MKRKEKNVENNKLAEIFAEKESCISCARMVS